ncbi:MAG: hypothetical protein PHI27_06345 [Eubacteriales bacterium]|nr:hypothetical protein [Eubacteriales bacterium]MDD3881854.1 hypothetical protein [Eubacteriales bacterium]
MLTFLSPTAALLGFALRGRLSGTALALNKRQFSAACINGGMNCYEIKALRILGRDKPRIKQYERGETA